jgi:DNA-binding IclR family transcriptional regulator
VRDTDITGTASAEHPRDYKRTQSIRRAAAILRVVAHRNTDGIRLSEISQNLGLNNTTVHRLLSSLVEEGLVSFDRLSKRYHLGFQLVSMGFASQQYLITECCSGAVEALARETGDTAYLFLKLGTDALCLKRAEGAYPVKMLSINEGDHRPLGIGGGPLALLAFLPEKDIEKIVAANSKLYSNYNNQTPDDIRRLVKTAKNLGYAWCDRQVFDNVASIGMPIRDSGNRIAASISIAAINTRMNESRRVQIADLFRKHIGQIVLPV